MQFDPKSPDSPESEQKPKIFDLVSILMILVGVILFSKPLFDPWAGKAEFLLSELLMFGITLVFLKLQKFNVAELIRWNPLPRKLWWSLLLLVTGFVILLDELDRIISILIPMPVERIDELRSAFIFSTLPEAIWIILGVVIAAPLIEETIFRGIFQGTLERSFNPTQAVLWTSLIFAIIHFQIWWFIQILLLSVLLGYLCWRSNSIFPAVFIHIGNNLWTIFIMNSPDHFLLNLYLWHDHVNPLLVVLAIVISFYGFKIFDSKFANSKE